MSIETDLARFYALLYSLEGQPGQGHTLAKCSGLSAWPARGMYFFREPGEFRAIEPETPRIVRVGTHAVSANSRSTLWGRLRAHRGARDGGGNHRGSIFRLHVGSALLRRDQMALGEIPTWAVGSSASKAVRLGEIEHERRVSEYLGRMSVFWLEIPDEPGRHSDRAYLERNSIALLSNGLHPLDQPSDDWLGGHSPRAEIRASGLWNLNHVRETYEVGFLGMLDNYIMSTIRRSG
jgi:hypothetical protein